MGSRTFPTAQEGSVNQNTAIIAISVTFVINYAALLSAINTSEVQFKICSVDLFSKKHVIDSVWDALENDTSVVIAVFLDS